MLWRRAPRAIGAALGLSAALVVLVVARPVANADGSTTQVRISVASSGELLVAPSAPDWALVAPQLSPGGDHAVGTVSVRNQTDSDMRLDLVARPSSSALDRFLQIRVTADGATVAHTDLGSMSDGIEPALEVRSGQTLQLAFDVWLVPLADDGYKGQSVDIAIAPAA